MENLQFSIIYAVIRQSISEKLSIGMVILDGNKVDVRYSEDKMKALKYLYPQYKYEFILDTIRGLPDSKAIRGKEDIDYLSRYSNNLISLSPLEKIDLEPTDKNKDWLFKHFVFSDLEA